MDVPLANAHLGAVVTTTGGSVWRFFAREDGREEPLFREPPAGETRAALAAGCFPLVPFGNRVRGNAFVFENRLYSLAPKTPSDRHPLHGDGWIGEWHVLRHGPDRLDLGFEQRGDGTPYRYAAEQSFGLAGRTFAMSLRVTNTGDEAMPFGLGWHPYFPMTPETILAARTRSYWAQDASWLPSTEHPTGGSLDFGAGAHPPRRWVNTQFEGWDGRATITWPERNLSLAIEADPLFDRCVLFVSDPAFDPGYGYEYFCFEPMSHSIDDHNRAGAGALRRLAPGDSLGGALRFTVDRLPDSGAPA